jgi:hypothetical protein
MTTIIPRYEFRAFAQNFGLVEDKIRSFSRCEKYRESREIYVLSAVNNENNTKIRDDKMDIKVFVKQELGLEQWAPRMKSEFPMAVNTIRDEVFPALGVPVPRFERSRYTLDQFQYELIRPHKDLSAAQVFKRRFGLLGEYENVNYLLAIKRIIGMEPLPA